MKEFLVILVMAVMLTSCTSGNVGYSSSVIADNSSGVSEDTSLPDSSDISSENDELEGYISEAIISENKSQFETTFGAESYPTEAHKILKKVEDGNSLKVYLVVLYAQYQDKDDEIVLTGAVCSPVSISFTKQDNTYIVDEYWVPEDGESYEKSVRSEFPPDIAEAVMPLEFPEGMEICAQAAEAYFRGEG